MHALGKQGNANGKTYPERFFLFFVAYCTANRIISSPMKGLVRFFFSLLFFYLPSHAGQNLKLMP